MKKVIIIAIAVLGLTACGGGSGKSEGDYVIKKTSDWEKLNLKDSVEEFWETNLIRSNITSYTSFNKDGFVTETGKIENEKKKVEKSYEYDAENNLLKIISGDKTQFFDNMGRLLKELRITKNWDGRVFRDSTVNRYQIDGRKETRYTNDNLMETIEYDKYRNAVSYLTYRKDSTKNTFQEFEYAYDKNNNIVKKTTYATMYYPLKENFKKELRDEKIAEYSYDENNRLTSVSEIERHPYQEPGKKIQYFDKSKGTSHNDYDVEGNYTSKGFYTFEYDRHQNWVVRYDNRRMALERRYKYFGSDNFENSNEGYEGEGGDEYFEEE
ncbi:MAG: hypothetical protein LBT04_08620 [Prevotellaceae bacterium]|jgi:hypothetical protein|nr:hypothetical protein [Prevotellaceae bacterium]